MAPYSFDLPHAGGRDISETQFEHITSAPNTSVAPVVHSSQTPSISYGSIAANLGAGGLAWSKFFAPVTNDPVYVAKLANGEYAYVGPDNKPYVGAQSDFYQSSQHGSNFIADAAGKFFNPLGPAKLAQDVTTWSAVLAHVPGVQQAHYGTAAVDVPHPPALSLPAFLKPKGATPATTAPIANPASTTVVGNSTSGSALTALIPQSIADALRSALTGGGGGFTSPDSGVGVPSTANVVAGDVPALDALQPTAVNSASTSNPSLLLAIVGAGAIAAFVLYERSAHKHPKKKKGAHDAPGR